MPATVCANPTIPGARGLADPRRFRLLVQTHQASVYRLVRSLVRDPALAEDVLQETFLAAFRSASSYRGDSSPEAWLFTIARNKAFRVGGREGRRRDVEGESPLAELGCAAGWGREDPERAAIRAQQGSRLRAALASLGSADQEVIALRDLEGLSGEACARVLGLSLAAMKSRLHRARLRLVAALREGEEEPDGP